jgi:hypothetical protein
LLAKNSLSKSGLSGRLYTNFKAAWSCIYLVFSQEQPTHRSMQYCSFQNLHAKNSFPKSGLPEQLYTKSTDAQFYIYLGLSQEQQII